MALADRMRKLAGMFVEIDQTAARRESDRAPSTAPSVPPGKAPGAVSGSAGSVRATGGEPAGGQAPDEAGNEIDRRLAQMNAQMAALSAGVAVPAAGSTAGGRSIADVVRESDGPSLEHITVEGAPPPADDGSLDFAGIYTAASLPAAPFSAEQTLDLLAKLPQNLPIDMKRQTLSVTISALGAAVGASPETIVADAARKMAALSSYTQDIDSRTEKLVALAEDEINQLSAQIESKRAAILECKRRQQNAHNACDAEADRLDDVLEFFSLDIGASKYAAPGDAPISLATVQNPPSGGNTA